MITIANANALHLPLPDQSVQCVITSPPYYGLRDYGTPGQIGLESEPAAYVANIVAVMRECWRVLKDDGVLWLNLGDSYASGEIGRHDSVQANNGNGWTGTRKMKERQQVKLDTGLKPKDLCGIPWRVAFALQDDGWYLRQDIIWSKPNPMPESVTDRCTKAHEYVFLLTKQARYYYDAEAIKEPIQPSSIERAKYGWNGHMEFDENGKETYRSQPDPVEQMGERWSPSSGRNRRSVWTVATSPYSGAHFATFPPALIEPMILAGTSARGECPHCGKAWVRVVEIERVERPTSGPNRGGASRSRIELGIHGKGGTIDVPTISSAVTLGWRQQCDCPPHDPIPQTVLDPFAGSGTTGAVAVKHGRRAVLLDLNTKYIDLQFERTNGVQMTMPV